MVMKSNTSLWFVHIVCMPLDLKGPNNVNHQNMTDLFYILFYSDCTGGLGKRNWCHCLAFFKVSDTVSHSISVSLHWGDKDLTGGPFNRKGTGWMATPRELQSTSQCPNGSASSSVPRGTLLGLILFNVLVNGIVELSTPLASWQGTPSSVVQLINLVEGMPSLGTLIGLRSGPVWTSLNTTWPRPKACTWVGATPSIRTDREWMVWEQPCGGLAGTVWWVDSTGH